MKPSCNAQRRLVLLLAVSTFCPAIQGGFRAEQRIVVQSGTNGANCVHAADLDGDGDLDVLSASSLDNKFAWYANDGTGHFGSQQVISTTALGANYVYAADLDGDGDLDVLSASVGTWPQYGGVVAWYANDGTGHFGHQQAITTEASQASCVHAADLDRDGDMDVLSASYDDDKTASYPNDGRGQFGLQQLITTAASSASCVYAADLDGDGDLDVLSASVSDDKIAWYVNDGTGRFGPQHVISTAALGAARVYAADLDGDGDLDVLSASWVNDAIAWYANDGMGQFISWNSVTVGGADGANCVYTADLDGDKDLDVLSASALDDKIAWYENE